MLGGRLAALSLAGLAFAAACSSRSGNLAGFPALARRDASPSLSLARGTSKIKHVIVIVQENRSFESLFAGYSGANAPMSGCAQPRSKGRTAQDEQKPSIPVSPSTSCPPGDTRVPLRQVTFYSNSDPNHNWHTAMIEWDHGLMDGFSHFGTRGPWPAYEYVDRAQTQPYWTMAKQYVLADAMFPTEFGGSFTGHLTLVAGTDDIKLPGEAEVDFPTAAPDDCDAPRGTKSSYLRANPYRKEYLSRGPYPCFDQFNTIAQVLDNAGISWRIYATRLLDAGFWEPFEAIKYVRFGSDWKHDVSAPQTNVLKDAMTGKLAQVTWVTPSGDDSDHPAYRKPYGPSWVTSVVNAVGQSSYWQSSAIIVVWDDWGGIYDNAPPPQLDYRGLGMRVPCLIISPYAKQNYVSHVRYEWGSILRFVEEVNGLPAGSIGPASQGYTDARAASLGDAFDFSQSPRPFKKIKASYPMSHFLNEKASDAPVDTE